MAKSTNKSERTLTLGPLMLTSELLVGEKVRNQSKNALRGIGQM